MGVVVPGNKQVGSYTFNLLQNSKPSVKLGSVTGFALTVSPVTGEPVGVYNVNLGTYSLTFLSNSKNSLKISAVLGLAIVKLAPPTQMYFNSIVGLAVVKDPDSSVILAPLENTSIGGVTFVSLLSAKKSISVKSVVGLALVQYFDQRKESIYHSINYGLNKTVEV